MEQYIRSGFAGFIYDFKDFDYTRTAYNLIRKHGYPHEFYYVNFTDMNRTYRFNPLDRRNIKDRTMLMQLMEDVLGALMPPTSKQDEWYTGALGILNGVAYRLWDEFPECCTLPHIFNFVMKADTEQLQEFLKLFRIGLHHEVENMRQRAAFRELIPKPVRHAVQDAKRARIPFVLFGCGRHQRAQYVLHQLHEHRPVLYIPPVQRIEAVSPVHVREIYIIELMGVSVFPDQVVCSPGIVKILEVIDETGESGPDVLFHQRLPMDLVLPEPAPP